MMSGIDLAHRRDPAVLADEPQIFLRRQDAAEQGAQLELVPAGVQGRVGQHGDADELDLVQQTRRARCAGRRGAWAGRHGRCGSAACRPRRPRIGDDGVVGADHVAHGAADAGIGRVGLLPDAVIGLRDCWPAASRKPTGGSISRLRKTPSSMALTGQTAVQRPHRVHLSLSHRICQGRSLTLSEEGLMGLSGCIC